MNKVIGEENGYFVQNNERLHILLKVKLEISLFQLGEFLSCFFCKDGPWVFFNGSLRLLKTPIVQRYWFKLTVIKDK